MIVSVLFPCSDGPVVTMAVFCVSPLSVRTRAMLSAACSASPFASFTLDIAMLSGPILCSPT